MAAEEFVGSTEVQQVAPFPESRLGLPGLLTTLADVDPLEAYHVLRDAGHANGAGETYPLPETELKVEGSVFTFTPIHSPFGERVTPEPAETEPAETEGEDPEDEEPVVTAEDVTRAIDEQLEDGKAVALLYKASGDPADTDYEWTMLTGYYPNPYNGEKGPYHTIDPRSEHTTKLSRNFIGQVIQRSLDHIDVYACTIEASPAS